MAKARGGEGKRLPQVDETEGGVERRNVRTKRRNNEGAAGPGVEGGGGKKGGSERNTMDGPKQVREEANDEGM